MSPVAIWGLFFIINGFQWLALSKKEKEEIARELEPMQK